MADPDKQDTQPSGLLSKVERDEFKQRLDELGDKLDDAKTSDQNDQAQQSRASGLAIAMRMGSEFVVAVLIGGAIGWYLDSWLGTTPFMLFIFVMLGFAAGTLNIIRASKNLDLANRDKASNGAINGTE